MQLLGSRLKQRRRQLRMRQGDVAGTASASFLSKVENGVATPSLGNLRDWSQQLQTSTADLLGDHLILEAAKHCILLTEKCHHYLDQLPPSPITLFLRDLSTCATALSAPVPIAPPDPELQYLTARVLWHRGMPQEGKALAERGLANTLDPFLRIRYFSLLCLIYGELHELTKKEESLEHLRMTIQELDHDILLHQLPEADALNFSDLRLLTLSALVQGCN